MEEMELIINDLKNLKRMLEIFGSYEKYEEIVLLCTDYYMITRRSEFELQKQNDKALAKINYNDLKLYDVFKDENYWEAVEFLANNFTLKDESLNSPLNVLLNVIQNEKLKKEERESNIIPFENSYRTR